MKPICNEETDAGKYPDQDYGWKWVEFPGRPG